MLCYYLNDQYREMKEILVRKENIEISMKFCVLGKESGKMQGRMFEITGRTRKAT